MDRRGHYNIRDQYGENVNNVAGNQVLYQQIMQERESFARQIAATKTKARALVWLGLLMTLGGATAFMIPILQAFNDFPKSLESSGGHPFTGDQIGDYSVGLIGFAVAFVGQFVLIIGIILHVVAASRRKTLLRTPIPDPRLYPGEWR